MINKEFKSKMKLQTATKLNIYNSGVPVQIDNFTSNTGKLPNHNTVIGRLNYRVQNDLTAIESGRQDFGMGAAGMAGERAKKSRMSLGANHLLS